MGNKNIEKLFDFLSLSNELKRTKRWLATKEMVWKESSADHSWHVALLILLAAEELRLDIDVAKAMKIALVHDLAEALAGDVDNALIAAGKVTKEEKYRCELEAITRMRDILPKKTGKIIYGLWLEYEEGRSREAMLVKAIDKIETINHMVVIGHECFDRPELIAPYPKKAVDNFSESRPLFEELLRRLKSQFEAKGWEWKEEHNNL